MATDSVTPASDAPEPGSAADASDRAGKEATADTRRLPRLAVDVLRGMKEMFRTTLALLTFEVGQTAHIAGMRIVTMVLAMAVLISGIALVISALAFWLGSVMGETWMGFAIVGGATTAIGAGTMAWAAQSIATRPDLRFPETRKQIRRDMKWLDRQLGSDDAQNSSD